MKRKDIVSIVAVAILGIVAAIVAVNSILGDINDKSATFRSIEVVNSNVGTPDPEVFNPDAINPTVDVYVGNCVDKNGNGQLDEDELIGCMRSKPEEEIVEDQEEIDEGQ
ncbi:MAG: hypothetical protein Q4A25_03420 [Candidatus Saccharibacteria bacterium]|nr:hypothetical protein [Candidatus Saccharibacteria bacterium]